MKIYYLLFSLFLLLSCAPNDKVPSREQPFFSIEKFFEKEKELLKNISQVEKTISREGNEETQNLTEPNFDLEIQLFKDADINRPALWDKYQVDSLEADGVLKSISYQAKNSSLEVQLLKVEYEAAIPSSIYIEKIKSNYLTDFHQKAKYTREKGFSIITTNETLGGDTEELSISILF